jgi:hypothetical protein
MRTCATRPRRQQQSYGSTGMTVTRLHDGIGRADVLARSVSPMKRIFAVCCKVPVGSIPTCNGEVVAAALT